MKTGLMILTLMFVSVSCSMIPSRSYLSEMEHDDSSFFQPREDFPVVPGDTGRDFRTDNEWKKRTPASETARFREREDERLENELKRLESAQSEGANKHYQQYRGRLGSISERIYFLQLNGKREREDYLAARGLLDSPSVFPHEKGLAVDQGELLLGMSKEDVEGAWGIPERVDVAGNPNYENERWLYRQNGAAKYVYFEGGRVGGWGGASR